MCECNKFKLILKNEIYKYFNFGYYKRIKIS